MHACAHTGTLGFAAFYKAILALHVMYFSESIILFYSTLLNLMQLYPIMC